MIDKTQIGHGAFQNLSELIEVSSF